MYPKKGWILAAALLILCSVGCTGQTGETHRLYVQTAGSESQIAETLPTAEQAEWMNADSNVVSTKAVKTKKATKTTTKKKKSSKKKTTTKQKKETTAKVTTEKAAKTTKPKTTKASKTTTAPRIAATMPRENPFRTTTVRNHTENASNRTTKTSSKAESPASVKMTTLKTNVVIRTQPPVPITIAPVETNPAQPEQQTDKYLSLSDGEMQGAGIVVSGNQIFLQAAGIYHLSGNWNGSICVQAGATDTVELRLEGASICGLNAPAIQIQQAGMVTITTADHQIGTVFQLVDLAFHAGTAVDCHRLHLLLKAGKLTDLVACLHCQFPCGTEDQGTDTAAFLLRQLSHLFQNRDTERRGFSGTGIGLADHVPALQQQRDRLFLNFSHFGKIQLCHSFQQRCG